MGVDYNHYVLIGVDISDKREEIERNDKFLPFIEGHHDVDFRIIDDRETEEFLYFGLPISSGDKLEGLDKKELDIMHLSDLQDKVRLGFKNVFDEEIDKLKIKLITCTVIW